MATSAINNFLAVFKSDASALPPPVRFIPAAFLFIHAEPLPEGVQATEVETFAGVSLEGLSPLSLDQLAWGYMADTRSRHLLLFGAFHERLNVENLSPEESFYHVLPSFFAAAPTDGAAKWVFLWEAGHVTGVYYNAGEVIPSRVEVERLKEDTLTEAFAGREHLLKRLGGEARNQAAAGLLAQPDAVRGSNDRLNFSYQQYTSPEAEPTQVAGNPPADMAARWSADLRGSAFRSVEQKRRKTVSQSARIMQAAAAVIVLLVVGQSVAFGMRVIINKKAAQIDSQKNMVGFVDTRLALLKQIGKFTDNQLHPIEMLGVINDYRPSGVSYKQTRIFNTTGQGSSAPIPTLVVSCEAKDPQDVTAFVTALSSLKNVDLDINKLNITNSLRATTFQLNLTYKSVPEAEIYTPPPPEPAADEQQAPEFMMGNQGGQFNPNGDPGQFAPQGGPQMDVAQQGPGEAAPAVEVAPASSGPTVYSSGAQGPAAPAPAPAPAPVVTPVAPAPAPAPAAQE